MPFSRECARFAAALMLALLAAGCRPAAPSPSATPEPAGPAGDSPAPRVGSTPAPPIIKPLPRPGADLTLHQPPPPPKEIWKDFSGERAFVEVKRQAEIGPRPAGSPEAEKARQAIIYALRQAQWQIQRQEFTDETPRGPVKFVNLIARYLPVGAAEASSQTQQAIVCSHYDTKLFSTIRFVGASDGASSTGALLELARVLALDPALAAKVELVFFDGEEAVQQFSETDGLYGSRHYSRSLQESGRARQFKFGILWDMIGDRDLTVTLSPDSPHELAQEILAAAELLGSRRQFSYYSRDILDDHVPLNRIHVPTIDLIDFDYLYWHTADDTLDKLSPASLQKVGAVTLYYLTKALP